MHLLIDYINAEGPGFSMASMASMASTLSPEVLPQSLRQLQLYTCFECWCRLDLASPQISSISFLKDLALHLDRFTHLEQVLYFSDWLWWLSYGWESENNLSRRDKKTGETWFPGSFERCASIFDAGNVYFRLYESFAFSCVGHSELLDL